MVWNKKHDHAKPFELDADEPPLLLGEGIGPNPVEYVLTALAACVTTALVYHAAVHSWEFAFLIFYEFYDIGNLS